MTTRTISDPMLERILRDTALATTLSNAEWIDTDKWLVEDTRDNTAPLMTMLAIRAEQAERTLHVLADVYGHDGGVHVGADKLVVSFKYSDDGDWDSGDEDERVGAVLDTLLEPLGLRAVDGHAVDGYSSHVYSR